MDVLTRPRRPARISSIAASPDVSRIVADYYRMRDAADLWLAQQLHPLILAAQPRQRKGSGSSEPCDR